MPKRKTIVARASLSDFLNNQVYPALAGNLGQAFPEFGFRENAEGWVATQWPSDFIADAATKNPERIQAYRDSPWGFYVHGRGTHRWLDYVAGAPRLRGRDFIEAVHKLAAAAGVPIPDAAFSDEDTEATTKIIQRQQLLEVAIAEAHDELLGTKGASAREYLESRGVGPDGIDDFKLGLLTPSALDRVRSRWMEAGGAPDVLVNTGLSDLAGYIIVPWLEPHGLPLSLYGRWPGNPSGGIKKTRSLPGKRTKSYPLFLERALKNRVTELVAVEGLFDAIVAQIHGDHRVVAYVGSTMTKEQVMSLQALNLSQVILCGDPDSGGDKGTPANVEALRRHDIAAYVAPRLPENTDPDEFILQNGIDAWRAHVSGAQRGLTWSVSVLMSQWDAITSDLEKDRVLKAVATQIQGRKGPDFQDALAFAAQRSGMEPGSIMALSPAPARGSNQRGSPMVGRPTENPELEVDVDFGGSLSDTANAKVLCSIAASRLRYVHSWGRWIVWSGKRWEADNGSGTLASGQCAPVSDWYRVHGDRIRNQIDAIHLHGDRGQCQMGSVRSLYDQIEHFTKQAKKTDSADGQSSMLKIASGMKEFQIRSHEALDNDAWVLNTESGVVDLRTGKLHEHDPQRLLTRLAPIAYDPCAKAPRFMKFMDEVFPNPEVRDFVRRAVGCALIGEQVEEMLLFFFGSGSNGKSTFIRILQGILGDYAGVVRPSFFDADARDEHATEIASLFKSRITICSESKENVSWNESKVKLMTGNDKRYARHMRQDSWSYVPTDTFIIHGNHRPVIKGIGDGIWRRIIIVPFIAKFDSKGDPQDGRLSGSIPAKSGLANLLVQEEGPGIMAYFVEGCIEYQEAGLAMPKAIRDLVDEYRRESDSVGGFLSDCCEISESEVPSVQSSILYEHYLAWLKESGVGQPVSSVVFADRLSAHGIRKKRVGGGRRYLGISLREVQE